MCLFVYLDDSNTSISNDSLITTRRNWDIFNVKFKFYFIGQNLRERATEFQKLKKQQNTKEN